MNRTGFVQGVPTEPTLASVCEYLDGYLRLRTVADYPNVLNGLQLANDGTVTRGCTGEGPHWTHALTEEAGIHLF